MTVVEKKRARSRRLASESREKRESIVSSKKAVQPTAAEHQIAEMEQTFTDRWEW